MTFNEIKNYRVGRDTALGQVAECAQHDLALPQIG